MSSWNFQDLTGQRFGKLTVLRKQSTTKDGQAVWVCVCDCGAIISASPCGFLSELSKALMRA